MLKSNRAQTIMELTIAAGILVVVAGLATMITARVYKSYEVIKAENEARKTVEEVLHTIAYGHEPGNGRGLIDATEINDASANEITFKGQGGESIKYTHNNPTIDQIVDTVESNDLYISDDVAITTFQLAYLDNLGAPTTTPTEVTQVKITIVAWAYIGADYRTLTVHTSIRPLNLYNL